MRSLDLPKKGTYTLIILVPSERWIEVGRVGFHKFLRGYYAYTGSAFGRGAQSLNGRIQRHLRKDKKKRWHIDFLLSEEDTAIIALVAAQTDKKMECEINNYMRDNLHAEILVPKFGSSDCKEGCKSHLLFFREKENIIQEISILYVDKIGKVPIILYF